jgi:hypothetical protein
MKMWPFPLEQLWEGGITQFSTESPEFKKTQLKTCVICNR